MSHFKKRLAKLFNEHYINVVEWSSGLKPEKMVCHNEDFDKRIVLHNVKKYENHSIRIKIKNNMSVKSHLSSNNTLSSARQVTTNEVNLILKSVNTKVSGRDKISTKLVKLTSNFNNSLASSNFLGNS